MSLYLAYCYSSCLTEEEENRINERVSQSQEQFYRGFNKGLKFSLMAYSIYSLTTRVAYAVDQCPEPDPTPAKCPRGKEIAKPGFKPVSPAAQGAAIGGATGVCGAALQSGDFIYGLLCAIFLIGVGIVNNRE